MTNSKNGVPVMLFPINVNNKWPDTIFAINRILRVKGRIKVLISSIKTMNLINGEGVPLGTKWANIWLVKVNQPNKKKPIHKGIEINKFVVKCLVVVNKLGIKPIKLEKRIKQKIEVKIILDLSFLVFSAISNCLLIFVKNKIVKIVKRVGFLQYT